MKPVELLLATLLWVEVAIAPALLGALLGSVYCIATNQLDIALIGWAAAIGLLPGIAGAEYLRRTQGLLRFHTHFSWDKSRDRS